MARIAPGRRRSSVTSIPGGLRIVIPAPRRWVVTLFLGAWLCGWAAGLVSAVSQLLRPGSAPDLRGPGLGLFFAVWLGFWLVGGALALWGAAWNVAGREVVSVAGSNLVVRREVAGIGRTRTFDTAAVRNLRVVPFSAGAIGARRRDWAAKAGRGPIAFDAGGTTQHLGAGLDDAEAEQLVAVLRERLPAASS
jgi:hypothetical protein